MFISRAGLRGEEIVNYYLSIDGVSSFLDEIKDGKYKIVFHYDEIKERLIYEAFPSDFSSLPKISYVNISISSNGLLDEDPLNKPSIEEMALYVYLYQTENSLSKEELNNIYLSISPLLNQIPSLEDEDIDNRRRLREEFLSIFDEKTSQTSIEPLKPSSGSYEVLVRLRNENKNFYVSLELWDGNEKKIPVYQIVSFLNSFSEEKGYTYRLNSYSLEHSLFLEKGRRILKYLETVSRESNDYLSNEMLLNENQFGDVIEIMLGENIYWNGSPYYIMKDVAKAGFKYKNNGDIELIPQIKDNIHCQSLLLKGGLLYFDEFSSVITLYRFVNQTSRKIFAFFIKHHLSDYSFVEDIFKKNVVLSSSLKSEEENARFGIALYVDISDKGALSFKTEYSFSGRKIGKKEAMLNATFASEINLYLAALTSVGGIEEGIQENQRESLKFLKSDLSLLKQRAKVYLSKKLSSSKITHMGSLTLHIERHEDWLSLKAKSKQFSSEQLTIILNAYRKKQTYVLLGEDIILLDDPKIAELNELKKKEKLDENFSSEHLTFSEAFRINDEYGEGQIKLDEDSSLKDAFVEIKNFKETKLEIPSYFEKELRPYQKNAVLWLYTLYKNHLGGILADDMGLGKTLETIAFLYSLKENKPFLIVAPKSVIYNWEKEFLKWNKDAKVKVIDGSKERRLELISSIKDDEEVAYITSYDSLRNDLSYYSKHNFGVLITDEAQLIKNYKTLKSKAVRNIHSVSRFALTGTPIENSMTDLWSIFDFLMPNYLNSYGVFKIKYVLAGNQQEARSSLRKRVSPFLLRRTKKEVLKELPKKETKVVTLTMDEESKMLYDSVLEKAKKDLKDAKDKTNPNHDRFSAFNFLPVLTSLREICVDPASFFDGVKTLSCKMSFVIDYAKQSISNGHKVLIFSSFTKVLDNVSASLKENGMPSYYINGKLDAKERLDLANKFNKENDVSVMLVSLKAGGTGLNLAGADIVIHMDPWWNIASEEQATDRAHRIGQKRPVSVLKLICHNSIEEKVLLLQNYKKTLYEDIIKSGDNVISSLSEEDIAFLLS